MEFFSGTEKWDTSADALFQRLTLAALPDYCASIDKLLSQDSEEQGVIYCLWGQFRVTRQRIRNGVRFSLPDCPHALAWTITVDESRGGLTIHCTIDKVQEEEEFVASIRQFVEDWADGLAGHP